MSCGEEKWRKIAGTCNYEVSNHGRVRSLGLPYKQWNGSAFIVRKTKPRILSLMTNSGGYKVVSIRAGEDNKSRQIKVHRAVLEAFVGPAPEGTVTCHRDDVKTNNFLSNLYWGTHSDNAFDRTKNGLSGGNSCHRNGMAKLKEGEHSIVMTMRQEGKSLKSIAERFGVSEATVSRITRGITWSKMGKMNELR